MKTCLLLLLSFFANQSFGQSFDINKRETWEGFKNKPLHFYKPQQFPVPRTNVAPTQQDDPMPVLKSKLTPVKIGNNGKGADVYAMLPYNMPCLVPDSTFHSSMPVKGFERVTPGMNR